MAYRPPVARQSALKLKKVTFSGQNSKNPTETNLLIQRNDLKGAFVSSSSIRIHQEKFYFVFNNKITPLSWKFRVCKLFHFEKYSGMALRIDLIIIEYAALYALLSWNDGHKIDRRTSFIVQDILWQIFRRHEWKHQVERKYLF